MTKKKKKSRSGKITTPLAGHKRVGKALVPPMLQLEGVSFSSWVNDRLPEMLWASLVITVIPRDQALEAFRDIAALGLRYRKDEREQATGWTLRHTHLPAQPRELFEALVGRVLRCHAGAQALRPLLLLENLPGITWWKAALGSEPIEDDWQTLGQAVQKTFDHQSQEATDVRWVSILFKIALGEMLFPAGFEEHLLEIVEYPNRGDMRSVRPSIRAMEMTFTHLGQSSWSESFWTDMLQQTGCTPAPLLPREKPSNDLQAVRLGLVEVGDFQGSCRVSVSRCL